MYIQTHQIYTHELFNSQSFFIFLFIYLFIRTYTSRFKIMDGTVWNVKLVGDEIMYGQAATFASWEDL